MIDAAAYRANETNAKRAIADWRLSHINDPYVFENCGFPVRADSFLDLAQILDTMQEGRFDYYMKELGGFTDEDMEVFVKVCLDYIDFYSSFFQREKVILPLSTLISHFVIYKKLIGYDPGFHSVLELGPGCGYLSFFLRDHQSLTDYTQIESTESFYLLQSHINAHVFGSRFAEHAISRLAVEDHSKYVPSLNWHNPFHYEEQRIIGVQTMPVCHHYPWWRIGDAAKRQYDIVTSNANLNEFSREALFQYLSLIRDVLVDDGVIVAQCMGGGPPTYDTIFANMKSAGFVPVALVQGDNLPGRIFVVSNAVFVGERHPLYAKYANSAPRFPTIDRNLGFVNKMFFLNEEQPERKKIRTIPDVMEAVLARVDASAQLRARASTDTASVGSPLRGVNRLRALDDLEKSAPDALQGSAAARLRTQYDGVEKMRLGAEISELKRTVQAMQSSRSWRVTSPLRSFGVWTRQRMPWAVRAARWARSRRPPAIKS